VPANEERDDLDDILLGDDEPEQEADDAADLAADDAPKAGTDDTADLAADDAAEGATQQRSGDLDQTLERLGELLGEAGDEDPGDLANITPQMVARMSPLGRVALRRALKARADTRAAVATEREQIEADRKTAEDAIAAKRQEIEKLQANAAKLFGNQAYIDKLKTAAADKISDDDLSTPEGIRREAAKQAAQQTLELNKDAIEAAQKIRARRRVTEITREFEEWKDPAFQKRVTDAIVKAQVAGEETSGRLREFILRQARADRIARDEKRRADRRKRAAKSNKHVNRRSTSTAAQPDTSIFDGLFGGDLIQAQRDNPKAAARWKKLKRAR